ncbi:hypothetical protein LZC95_16190 [Pendulispora brunnea]|uniref:Lipoprotein n=1 Tax=Pendulispora brunnea TaxID=2905690 RepID=A0ABZ2KN16_9BACT
MRVPSSSLVLALAFAPLAVRAVAACGGDSSPPPTTPAMAPETATTASAPPPPAPKPVGPDSSGKTSAAEGTFDYEVEFLRKYGTVEVLEAPNGGRVAISPTYQGRVMTSAVGGTEKSIGWVNHKFIEEKKTGAAFDNYGGEDRFWLGPEGGQFALFFAPGSEFNLTKWQTPAALQEGAWTVAEKTPTRVVFKRNLTLKNYKGTEFSLEVERTIDLLSAGDVEKLAGTKPGEGVKWVGFSTTNKITNTGAKPWTKEAGLLSVWILGQFNPAPDAYVVVPFEAAAKGEVVNDRYFGKVPADRLANDSKDGYLRFKADGQHRSKIGLGPSRAKNVLGSYAESLKLLTVVSYDKPKSNDYVNSMWEKQKAPYGGDVVNSYNDGPTDPGKPSLGGFYELETSSPAAALAPKASLVHTSRTFHFVGDRTALDPIAKKALNASLAKVAEGIH